MTGGPSLLPHRVARLVSGEPEAIAFRFVSRPAAPATEITWRELGARAAATAELMSESVGPGGRVGIAAAQPLEFVVALVACLLSGRVAVPVPIALSRRSAPRANAILAAARVAAVLVPEGAALPAGGNDIPAVPIAGGGAGPGAVWRPAEVGADDLAIIQFSSGSTGTPRGVALTHGNLSAACAAIIDAYGLGPASRGVSWLPLHHDMGLVGHVLTPLVVGGRSTLMDPLRFLQRPLDWLHLVSSERATITSAPNFAYELCARAAAEGDLAGMDLSSLTAAICGGEPVLPATVEAFIAAFQPVGFRPPAFAPSYGLAEATLLVSSGRRASGPAFGAKPGADHDEPPAAPVADLGTAVAGMVVRVVDDAGVEVTEGSIGEVEIAGPSVGRMIRDDGTLAPAGPVRTGDLAFMRYGSIHIVGRLKDLIIVRGQNIYPADVEAAALEAHPAVMPGGLAAVGVARDGSERLVVLVEVSAPSRERQQVGVAVRSAVNEQVARRIGHTPGEVVVLRVGALPRTSSGKVRRLEAARMYVAGAFDTSTDTADAIARVVAG